MIKKEICIFLIVGIITVIIDFLIYYILLEFVIKSIDISKTISFVSGTVFSYLANRFWTFGHISNKINSLWKFILIYSLTLIINVQVNSLFLFFTTDIYLNLQIAFLFATITSASINFLGMKYFVFKK